MGEDDSGFGLLGHVAAPYQLGLPRGLPAPAHCGERRSHASHGRIVTEVRVRGEGAARERGHFSLLHDSWQGISGGWPDPIERVSRRQANICVPIFESLGKRWQGISGGWADLRERESRGPANNCVPIFEGLGK